MTINPQNDLNNPAAPDYQREVLEMLRRFGHRKKVRKGESILLQGDVCDDLFYIERGCFRAFRFLDETEITVGFSFSGDIDTCPYSFINRVPSRDTIEALSDGVITRISRMDIERLTIKYPEMCSFTQSVLAHYIEVLIQRLIELKTIRANVLYEKLVHRQPQEVAKIPLMYIASYLGISKERLSRIRKEIRPIDQGQFRFD